MSLLQGLVLWGLWQVPVLWASAGMADDFMDFISGWARLNVYTFMVVGFFYAVGEAIIHWDSLA